MSSYFMFFIAACYLCAAITFSLEAKFMWAAVSLSWGIGNALIGVLSQ